MPDPEDVDAILEKGFFYHGGNIDDLRTFVDKYETLEIEEILGPTGWHYYLMVGMDPVITYTDILPRTVLVENFRPMLEIEYTPPATYIRFPVKNKENNHV